MNKIDTFCITGLTAQGFKCFADKQHFSFGGINAITGHNGQGKSSIADAISYAITGAPFGNGEHSLDRLYTLNSKNITVELDIDTGNGQLHKLTRSHVNDVTSVTYDGVTIRQSDLSDMFGEKDVFLSIFNPLYFIEVLGDKVRNLLQRHLPAIPHEAVLAGLSESTRTLLEGVQMCKQDITEQNIEAVKKSFADSITEVLEKGRGLTAQLAELTALDEKVKSVFGQFQSDDIAKLESDLEALKGQREKITADTGDEAETRRQTMDRLKGEIQTLELDIEYGNLTADEAQELMRLKQQKDDLTAEITVLAKAEPDQNAEGKTGDIDSLKIAIKQKQELETAAKFYIGERNRLMFSEFDALSRVSIVLLESIKTTGEVKDVFKFSYDGKPYKYLSLSEKIKAGIEVSELVKRLTGHNYPLFIDNGESVPVIDNVRPSGQVFIAQVVKGAALKAEIIGGQRDAENQKAA